MSALAKTIGGWNLASWLRGVAPARAGVMNVPGDSAAVDGRGLLRDSRGVIMVVGVVFAFLWIGLCWSIFGIGNAIAYRENLQNAADASAFAAAVYDARGMNMLVSINIVMGIVLAVLIAMHLIQVALLVILGIDCWSCVPDLFCGYGWAECPGDCSSMSDMNGAVQDVDKVIHPILQVLHDLEVGIAIGWPWVSSGKSTTIAGGYYKNGVEVTSSFAFSQIPWNGDELVSGNFSGFLGSITSSTPGGVRYGLPVASDKYTSLCEVAFLDMTTLGGLIPTPGFIAQFLNAAGNWFCDAGGDSAGVTDAIEALSCAALPCLLYGPDDPFPSLPASDNQNNHFGPADSPPLVKADDVSESPMKLYAKAEMGKDYYGVWSTAVGKFTDVVTRKVAVAAQTSKAQADKHDVNLTNPIPSDVALGVSKAEFYYEPRGGDSKSDETTVSIPSSGPILATMWNLRWRARLRRYHNFPGILGEASPNWPSLANANWGKAATSGASALLGGASPTDALTAAEESLNDEVSGPVNVDSYKNKPAAGIYH